MSMVVCQVQLTLTLMRDLEDKLQESLFVLQKVKDYSRKLRHLFQ